MDIKKAVQLRQGNLAKARRGAHVQTGKGTYKTLVFPTMFLEIPFRCSSGMEKYERDPTKRQIHELSEFRVIRRRVIAEIWTGLLEEISQRVFRVKMPLRNWAIPALKSFAPHTFLPRLLYQARRSGERTDEWSLSMESVFSSGWLCKNCELYLCYFDPELAGERFLQRYLHSASVSWGTTKALETYDELCTTTPAL